MMCTSPHPHSHAHTKYLDQNAAHTHTPSVWNIQWFVYDVCKLEKEKNWANMNRGQRDVKQ